MAHAFNSVISKGSLGWPELLLLVSSVAEFMRGNSSSTCTFLTMGLLCVLIFETCFC